MAAQGAPNKKGLDYFPKMVDFYTNNDRIFDLLDEHGPLGVTVYDCILTIVYSNGYYADMSKDKLSRMVIKCIGNKWIKNKNVVVQVIDYCAELGLLSKDLMLRNIITSVGIQKRYYKVAVKLMKRQLYSDEYWMLDENGDLLLNSAQNQDNSEISPFNSEEINHNSEVSPIKEKESKRNRNKENKTICPEPSKEATGPAVFELILNDGSYYPACQEEIDKYKTLYPAVDVEQEYRNMIGWLDTHQKNRKTKSGIGKFITSWLARTQNSARPVRQETQKKNAFHNFDQRDTNYDALVQEQVKSWIGNQQEGG